MQRPQHEFYVLRGNSLINQGNTDEAIVSYFQAITYNENYLPAYAGLVKAYKAKGDHKEVVEYSSKVIELTKNDEERKEAFLERADAYLELDEANSAFADYERVIRLDPGYAPVYLKRGRALETEGKHASAIDEYDKFIKLNSSFALAYVMRGEAYQELGDSSNKPQVQLHYFTKAINDFEQAIAKNIAKEHEDNAKQSLVDAYRSRGETHIKLGNSDAAIADYKQAIQIDPGDIENYRDCGEVYSDKNGDNDFYEAIAYFSQVIALNENYPGIYFLRGCAHEKREENDEAISDFEKALNQAPENGAEIQRRLEVLYRSRQESTYTTQTTQTYNPQFYGYPPQTQTYQPPYYSQPQQTQTYQPPYYAQPQQTQTHQQPYYEHPEEAPSYRPESSYQQESVEPQPRTTQDFCALGRKRHAEGNLDAAIACYLQVIEHDSNYPGIYLLLANAYEQGGHANEAIDNYKKAIQQNPNDAIAYFNLGNIYGWNGKLDNALDYYDKAIAISPDASSYFERAVIHESLGNFDLAIADFSEAIKLEKNRGFELGEGYGEALFLRGSIYEKQGKWDLAYDDFSAVIQFDPKDREAFFRCGSVSLADGKPSRALFEFDLAIKDYPDAPAKYYRERGKANEELAKLSEGQYSEDMFARAIFDYDRTLELNKGDSEAYNKLKALLAQKDRDRIYSILDRLPTEEHLILLESCRSMKRGRPNPLSELFMQKIWFKSFDLNAIEGDIKRLRKELGIVEESLSSSLRSPTSTTTTTTTTTYHTHSPRFLSGTGTQQPQGSHGAQTPHTQTRKDHRK